MQCSCRLPSTKAVKNYTKKKTRRYKEQSSEKVEKYLTEIYGIDPESIVYVDETGIDTFLQREYAYSKRGEPVIGYVAGKKYRRVGIVAARVGKKIIAPFQYDGTMDSMLFEFWFENCLLCELPPNSVIVMDNASFHRKKRLVSLTLCHGHRLVFLPPYSPELNPIEKFWAWLKMRLKFVLPTGLSFDDALRYCFMVN